jgi:hypothetical protein
VYFLYDARANGYPLELARVHVAHLDWYDRGAVGLSAGQRPRWTLVDAAWTPKPAADASRDNGTAA